MTTGMHHGGKGLGWRRNTVNHALDRPAHRMLARKRAALPAQPPLDHANLLNFRGRRIDQGRAGACVAFATARALELGQAANFDAVPVLPSPLQLYYDGRREEWAGQDPANVPPLEDTGTEPRLMMTALEAEGYVSWDTYPYTDDPIAINREPPPNVYAQAYSQRGLDWAVVGDVGLARVERVRQALCARMPVIFGMVLDEAFMRNGGTRITMIDSHRIVGGHMLCVLAVLDAAILADFGNTLGLPADSREGDVLFDNWWGTGVEWGTKDGFGVLSGSLFGGLVVDDVTIFEAVPPVRVTRPMSRSGTAEAGSLDALLALDHVAQHIDRLRVSRAGRQRSPRASTRRSTRSRRCTIRRPNAKYCLCIPSGRSQGGGRLRSRHRIAGRAEPRTARQMWPGSPRPRAERRRTRPLSRQDRLGPGPLRELRRVLLLHPARTAALAPSPQRSPHPGRGARQNGPRRRWSPGRAGRPAPSLCPRPASLGPCPRRLRQRGPALPRDGSSPQRRTPSHM